MLSRFLYSSLQVHGAMSWHTSLHGHARSAARFDLDLQLLNRLVYFMLESLDRQRCPSLIGNNVTCCLLACVSLIQRPARDAYDLHTLYYLGLTLLAK
jgi:hypothetical protein